MASRTRRGAAQTAPNPTPRTRKRIAAEYGYLFGVGLLSVVLICWVAF